jgi:hypothetical protein
MSALALRQSLPIQDSPLLGPTALISGLTALQDCQRMCEDAGGETVGSYGLMSCIELFSECQRHCAAAMRFLSELSEIELPFMRSQLGECAEVCDRCTKECLRYRDFENWSQCADANRDCAEICRYLLLTLPTAYSGRAQ